MTHSCRLQEGTDDQTSLWLTKLQAWCCLDLAQVEPSGPGSWTSELTESDEGAHLQGGLKDTRLKAFSHHTQSLHPSLSSITSTRTSYNHNQD